MEAAAAASSAPDVGAASNPPSASSRRFEALRAKLLALPNRTPEEQEISLEFREITRQRLVNNGNLETRFQLAELIIRSGSRNALSGRMICQLAERLDQLERWLADENKEEEEEEEDKQEEGRHNSNCTTPATRKTSTRSDLDARCLIIRGHGGTFCSGSDLMAVRRSFEGGEELALELALLMQSNLERLERLATISVAFVEGFALGGGAELLLATDLRLISSTGRIGYVQARNGICCGWGGGARLIELVGRARALELLASGRLVKADEALQLNLCSARAESLDEAIEFALKHAIESRLTCRAVKSLVNDTRQMAFSEALAHEARLFARTWGREAHLRSLDCNLKHNK